MMYREMTCVAALDRTPLQYGQPLLGWDEVGMGWVVGVRVGLGIIENKSKVVGEKIKINRKRVMVRARVNVK